jgi:hypothetical protein
MTWRFIIFGQWGSYGFVDLLAMFLFGHFVEVLEVEPSIIIVDVSFTTG